MGYEILINEDQISKIIREVQSNQRTEAVFADEIEKATVSHMIQDNKL